MLDELKARERLIKLALTKLNSLVPGKDAVAKQEKLDIMRECYGVTGRKAFEALDLKALREGWEKLQTWRKEEPPAPEPEAGGSDFDVPTAEAADHEGDEDEMDDAAVTAWLLKHLREQAKVLGQDRAFEDFLQTHTGDEDYDEHHGLVLDEDGRNAFLTVLMEELPDLASTLPTE